MGWLTRLFDDRNPRRGRPRLGFEVLERRDNPAAGWDDLPAVTPSAGGAAYLHPDAYRAVDLDAAVMRAVLAAAPDDAGTIGADALVLTLPGPDGTDQRFAVVDAPVMAPELAAEFPDIETFRGQGLDDPAATLRLDLTPQGLHAQVLSPNGAWYVDPYYHLEDDVHISYYRRDLGPDDVYAVHADGTVEEPAGLHKGGCGCELCTGAAAADTAQVPRAAVRMRPPPWLRDTPEPTGATANRSGTVLRTYRTAVAATGEYTAFHGGTAAAGQAAIVTAMNRVTGVYETELSIRMVLVANNQNLVYTNASTDPYSNTNASALLTQNQANVDLVIGSANYDIGHVFGTGGGGLAGLGVVGNPARKAQGETGSGSPINDAFTIDYVAHEMGHQFGGNHTFDTIDGNRSSGTAYEPGSGTTIMGYAGVFGGSPGGTSENVQLNSDPYFSFASFNEIVAFVDNVIPSVGARANTGNLVPAVNAGADYVIPARTPFALTASGSDGNNDPLTYSWEQSNRTGSGKDLQAADTGLNPLFRALSPTAAPTRTFPRLSNLVANTVPIGEMLPTANWAAMTFRVTARDSRANGGGVNTDDMSVQVVNTGTAFAVTSPNTAVTWNGLSTQTVTWAVANTTASPISAANVNVTLSLDGGLTYPVTLAANVPNTGSASITVPNTASTLARVRVQPVNNIFFDISNANLTIARTPVVESVVVNDGALQRSRLTTIAVTFDSVATVAAGAFGLTGVSPTGAALPVPVVAFTTQPVGGKTVATLSFSGDGTEFGSLADGTWNLTIDRTKITLGSAQMAADYSSTTAGVPIRRLFGDSDGDGDTDTIDLGRFRQAFSGAVPNLAAFDSEGDGDVDTIDLGRFRQRFGVVLPP